MRREDGKFGQRMAGDLLEKGGKGVVLEERWLVGVCSFWDRMLPTSWCSQFKLPFLGKLPDSQSWGDRCLDLGLQQWWGLPTAVGRTSVQSGI